MPDVPRRRVSKIPGKTPPTIKPANDSRPEHYVYIEKGVTKNLGDYNFARIDIGITVRVDPTPEELKQIKRTITITDTVLEDEMVSQLKDLEVR